LKVEGPATENSLGAVSSNTYWVKLQDGRPFPAVVFVAADRDHIP